MSDQPQQVANRKLSALRSASPALSTASSSKASAAAVEEVADDPRLVHAVNKFRDVVTDLDSLTCVEEMRKGAKFLVWFEDSKVKTKEIVAFPATLSIDQFNDEITIKFDKKKPKPKIIPVGNLRELRYDYITEIPKLVQDTLKEDISSKMISVLHGRGVVNVSYIHIACDDKAALNVWKTGFKALVQSALANRLNATTKSMKAKYLRLQTIAKNNMAKFGDLMKKLNVGDSKRKKIAMEFLNESEVDWQPKKKTFDISKFSFNKFVVLHNELDMRSDIAAIFQGLLGEGQTRLSADQFGNFLMNEQGLPTNIEQEYIVNLINNNEPHPAAREANELSVDGFVNYLMSPSCDVVDVKQLEKNTDMNEPISHYFIDSSHNTYLTGHQLLGFSSVEMYIQILLSGCRCIELDTWDGPNDIPLIYHGYTFTTRVKFYDVICAIKKYAFLASPYPLTLSIENHCGLTQQKYMAEKFVEVFGDMLVTFDQAGNKEGQTWERVTAHLPSPENLKYKVLIKCKKKRAHGEVATVKRKMNFSTNVSAITKQIEEGAQEQDITIEELEAMQDDIVPEEGAAELTEKEKLALVKQGIDAKAFSSGGYEKSTTNIAKELSDLVKYTESVPFRSFGFAKSDQACTQMSSFSERRALAVRKKAAKEFVHHNVRQLTRVYPNGYRFDSSNYNPMLFWVCGVQMVALNYQTPDLAMQINRAMFERNGGTGYILKPKAMRYTSSALRPLDADLVPNTVPTTVELTVVSAQHMPLNSLGLSVTVETFGLPSDSMTFTTSRGKGTHPSFNETFTFSKLKLPELVVVRFSVNGLGAVMQRTIALKCIKQGYRHVPLHNEWCVPLVFSSLLVRVKFTEHPDLVPRKDSRIASRTSSLAPSIGLAGSDRALSSSLTNVSEAAEGAEAAEEGADK